MKKLIPMLAILLALCMILPACSGGASGGKVLTVQVGPDPETLDPALNSAVDGGNMLLHTFECLLTVDKDGAIAPGCAET